MYELHTSLGKTGDYTWDLYNVLPDGSVIGIVTGLAAVDGSGYPYFPNALKAKGAREARFSGDLTMKGLMFDCAEGEASFDSDRIRIIAAIGAVEEQQQLNRSLHGRVAAASLRPALEQGGKLAELAIDAIKKGRLVRFELAMTDSKADTVENVQSLVSALDPETLQQLALFSQCWKRANEWLAEAIAGRVFASLLKLELQSESLLRHCLSVPHRCSACFARSPQPSSTACSCLPTAAPGHALLCPPAAAPHLLLCLL